MYVLFTVMWKQLPGWDNSQVEEQNSETGCDWHVWLFM